MGMTEVQWNNTLCELYVDFFFFVCFSFSVGFSPNGQNPQYVSTQGKLKAGRILPQTKCMSGEREELQLYMQYGLLRKAAQLEWFHL